MSSKRAKIANDDKESEDSIGSATSDLYKRLLDVDPERASEIHPNERRKIVRSLQGKQFYKVHVSINFHTCRGWLA